MYSGQWMPGLACSLKSAPFAVSSHEQGEEPDRRMEEQHIAFDPVPIISAQLQIAGRQVSNTLQLLGEGATIPFIARYRKEMTGGLDEVQIREIRDLAGKLRELEKRRVFILETIAGQGNLTPELEASIRKAQDLSELEDLYLPFKPRRRTRATVARERGLEPLARILMSQQDIDIRLRARYFVKPDQDVPDEEAALAGARDIIAEWITEDARIRAGLRNLFIRHGIFSSRCARGKEEEAQKFRDYFQYSEPLQRAPSHRVLAVLRGENEGLLRLHISPPEDQVLTLMEKILIRNKTEAAAQVRMAMTDAWARLLQPSLETEMRQWTRERADLKAVRVFASNLRQLLMAAPMGAKNVLAIDPGYRTGCKVVCLDRQGRLVHNETIYPHPPKREFRQAMHKILQLVDAYKIEAIAIGNGTASRETEDFIRRIPFNKDLTAIMVNESGASIYSASDIAREEFPDYDVTVRGAVSIGRRLMDPLAELVKIDPKSIGVGQYQHDVDQTMLRSSLEEEVGSCVNAVGVEVNLASRQLLSYVSGVGPTLASNIIAYRDANGPFRNRRQLQEVPRFGARAFEQAAGFLRIREGDHPLDASAVHPESYPIVEKMATDLGCDIADLLRDEKLRERIEPEKYITDQAGLPTIMDILQELARPGRDPRKQFSRFEFDRNVHSIEDLKPGMLLPGIVTNITAFGAFVDVGVHQDGLVHISELSDHYIKDPNEAVRLNQQVLVKVLVVDTGRKRIQLSMKQAREGTA